MRLKSQSEGINGTCGILASVYSFCIKTVPICNELILPFDINMIKILLGCFEDDLQGHTDTAFMFYFDIRSHTHCSDINVQIVV